MHRIPTRDGYALLAVLWISAAIAAVGISVAAAARDAMTASRNRIAASEAEWLAEGCQAHARSLIGEALRHDQERRNGLDKTGSWLRVDSLLETLPSTVASECKITARAVGAHLDVNAAEEHVIARVLALATGSEASADSGAAALADWRDSDDEPRALGAERAWYDSKDRFGPSNRPFADRREVGLVRGMSSLPWADLFDVESGPISMNHAPAPILAMLPGFSLRTATRVVQLRHQGRTVHHFRDIADELAAPDAEAVMQAVPALASRATFEPIAWLVIAEVRHGATGVTVITEHRLERTSLRVRLTRRRTWVR